MNITKEEIQALLKEEILSKLKIQTFHQFSGNEETGCRVIVKYDGVTLFREEF